MTRILTSRQFYGIIAIYAIGAGAIFFISPFLGGETLNMTKVMNGLFHNAPNVDADIFVYHRLPRVLLAFIVGGTLGVVGAALQVVLKNVLAEPYILGIAGGGAVGAVAAISIPGMFFHFGPFTSIQFLSLAGCMFCISGLYWLAQRPTGISMNTILLAGVTFNILCGAAILLIRYLVNPHQLVAMDRWMMGGLDVVGYQDLVSLTPFLIPGLFMVFMQANSLNQLAFGEDMAHGRGVDVQRVQRMVFLGAGLATAAAVSLAGPIGFVGLVIPHAVRRLSGYDHRVVLPASFLLGGGVLTLCDLVARTAVHPTEMPVGIITAIIGGPVFLRILLVKK
ncbi:transport system permease protein [Desulfatibacillum aliphaticivorans]|uniref:Transport system permease protein n=1 Tax=Desulfatibacillum aliphaticivorans TaxID=218208 RepID=B8FHP9_DESAL|nr:iron ABC transporter permease [Desulfatibacillum aliphaticivorans]ACL02466.1 transport system permease protein [Desulfatibacillum aliphaticivorans]